MQTIETQTKLFELPELGYSYKALEPYIDGETMKIHHKAHHSGYVNNLNNAVKKLDIKITSIENLLKSISKYPKEVRNNAGGHYNHSLFWKILGAGCGEDLSTELMTSIDNSFDTLEDFKQQFESAALGIFGSGWVWAIVDFNNKIKIVTTSNQDNPLMDDLKIDGIPILCLDVWEHAYYLKYQNNRKDYVKNFWSIVNWKNVDQLYNEALTSIYL